MATKSWKVHVGLRTVNVTGERTKNLPNLVKPPTQHSSADRQEEEASSRRSFLSFTKSKVRKLFDRRNPPPGVGILSDWGEEEEI